ncbi:MAG: nucleotidyltransferase domain-containing protein [Negativicutes bacterium]|nr:nucleotidyltransferase domain-containing protein [Negativicutes bacterium]
MLSSEQIDAMTPDLICAEIEGIAVMGSYARGDATPYSDLDVICLTKEQAAAIPEPQIDLYHGVYRVIQHSAERDLRLCFADPVRAVYDMIGLRQMRILYDPRGILRRLQQDAYAFVWDETMRQKADAYLNREMLVWQEECYKAMAGVRDKQDGKMLLGLYGLTYGLVKLMLVAKGVLLQSENDFYEQLCLAYSAEAKGRDLVEMMGLAFGLADGFPLLQRVETGLLLYLQLAEYLAARLTPNVQAQCERIQMKLQEIMLNEKKSMRVQSKMEAEGKLNDEALL